MIWRRILSALAGKSNKLVLRIFNSLSLILIIIFFFKQSIYNTASPGGQSSLFLYVGHQEKKPSGSGNEATANHLFTYDLGQFVLSRDASYSLEHLILLLQTMDTNISHLEDIGQYEWGYLNSLVSSTKPIESIQRKFNELCEQIKSRVVAVYQPRYPHVCGIKYANNRGLSYQDLATTCKSQQQSTFDIVLARIGGIQQMLVLVAKMVESENSSFYNKK
jgi:hypothetical protein